MARIAALEPLGTVEIAVVGSPVMGPDGSWHFKVVVRKPGTTLLSSVITPIGSLPFLSAGRVFVDGKRSDLAWTGTVHDITIPGVADCEEIGSDEVPEALLAPLFPSKLRRGQPQSVLLYCVGGLRIYVPAIELIRACHLPCSTLANAILRPQALMELHEPRHPGTYATLELNFSASLPVGLLRGARGHRFAERFAWIAVHPEGRKSWDSVARLTSHSGRIRIEPPRLKNSVWRARMIRAEDAALVLEIVSLSGKEQTADEIVYTHPKLIRRMRSVPRPDQAPEAGKPINELFEEEADEGDRGKGDGGTGAGGEKHLVVESAPGKRKADQAIVAIDCHGHEFDRAIPIRDRRVEVEAKEGERSKAIVTDADEQKSIDGGDGAPIRKPQGAEGKTPAQPLGALPGVDGTMKGSCASPGAATPASAGRRELRKVTVAEPEPGGALDPIEFSTLERMDSDYVGALGPLVEVLRRMDVMLPGVRIASSLTPLPDGRAISRIGSARVDRRPALIAVLWPAERGPTLLIDVDHSGGVSVAMLALRYGTDAAMQAMEDDVKAMLTALVAKGFWAMETLEERVDAGALTADRLVKVLRHTRRAEDEEYIDRWVLVLIERLGFQGDMEFEA